MLTKKLEWFAIASVFIQAWCFQQRVGPIYRLKKYRELFNEDRLNLDKNACQGPNVIRLFTAVIY
jgi:hypothetical protein